jgi:protein involved in polysaccharide export with SLBB domain
LKNKIVAALQEYIIKPDVYVSLQSVQSRKFYITGERPAHRSTVPPRRTPCP